MTSPRRSARSRWPPTGISERIGFDTGRQAAPTAARDVIEWERVVEVDGEGGRVVVHPE